MLSSTWPFRKEKVEKTVDQKEREEGTHTENRCNLTLKINISVLGFSVATLLLKRNTPISQRISKIY